MFVLLSAEEEESSLSPKRISLDDRIELELGVKRSPPPLTAPAPPAVPPPQYLYPAYAGYPYPGYPPTSKPNFKIFVYLYTSKIYDIL